VRHTHTDYLTTNPVNGIDYTAYTGAHIRSLPTALQIYAVNPANGQETLVGRATMAYDQGTLSDCPGITGHDSAFSTAYTTRGNPTSMTAYTNATNGTGALITSMAYDIAGNLVQRTDARGKVSTFSYSDAFSDSVNRNT
jgi:YD repeat-containing protein